MTFFKMQILSSLEMEKLKHHQRSLACLKKDEATGEFKGCNENRKEPFRTLMIGMLYW